MAAGDKWAEQNMLAMLTHRMGWNVGDPSNPMRRVVPLHLRSKEVVAVFLVIADRYVTIEDSTELYPSDQLVTQIRMFIADGKA